jgi:hypothetical protein
MTWGDDRLQSIEALFVRATSTSVARPVACARPSQRSTVSARTVSGVRSPWETKVKNSVFARSGIEADRRQVLRADDFEDDVLSEQTDASWRHRPKKSRNTRRKLADADLIALRVATGA